MEAGLRRRWAAAARRADLGLLRALLSEAASNGAEGNTQLLTMMRIGSGAQDNTALHVAALRGASATALWLVSEGADPAAPNSRGLNAEQLAAAGGHAATAAELRQVRLGRAAAEAWTSVSSEGSDLEGSEGDAGSESRSESDALPSRSSRLASRAVPNYGPNDGRGEAHTRARGAAEALVPQAEISGHEAIRAAARRSLTPRVSGSERFWDVDDLRSQ